MNVAEEIARGEALIRSLPHIAEFALIGSAMYLPDPNDVDFAVLLDTSCEHQNDAMSRASSMAGIDGWELCGDYDTATGAWCAVRKGNLNLMLTHDRKFYDGYKLAMEVCKVLRLTNKEDRMAVCRVVRDGIPADTVRPPLRPPFLPA